MDYIEEEDEPIIDRLSKDEIFRVNIGVSKYAPEVVYTAYDAEQYWKFVYTLDHKYYNPDVIRFIKKEQERLVRWEDRLNELKDFLSNFKWDQPKTGERIFKFTSRLLGCILYIPKTITNHRTKVTVLNLEAFKPGASSIRGLKIIRRNYIGEDGNRHLEEEEINREYYVDELGEIILKAFSTLREFWDECVNHYSSCACKVEEIRINLEKVERYFYPWDIKMQQVLEASNTTYKLLEELRVIFAPYKYSPQEEAPSKAVLPNPGKNKLPQDKIAQNLLKYCAGIYEKQKKNDTHKRGPNRMAIIRSLFEVEENAVNYPFVARIYFDNAAAANDMKKRGWLQDNWKKIRNTTKYKDNTKKWGRYLALYIQSKEKTEKP